MERLELYDGDYIAEYEITEEKKNLIVERILKFCKDTNCASGETLHQNDNCNIEAPSVLSDIIDDIIEFKTHWVENDDDKPF